LSAIVGELLALVDLAFGALGVADRVPPEGAVAA